VSSGISLRAFSITAAGGFRGHKRGAGQRGDVLVFLRDDSPSDLEKEWVTMERDA
jgi:hypothetical protein